MQRRSDPGGIAARRKDTCKPSGAQRGAAERRSNGIEWAGSRRSGMASHPTRGDIHLLDRFFYLDPQERFRWMRDHAPAYFEPEVDELGGIWGLTRHADIMHASKHPELF